DEDGYDHQRPAQRVPTLVLGSAGVRQGYVSHARYTHYSLLRTIEGALGLRTLTGNDRWAQPANDVFGDRRAAAAPAQPARAAAARPEPRLKAPAPATGLALTAAGSKPAGADVGGPAARGQQPTAFVVNSGSASVTPIDLA